MPAAIALPALTEVCLKPDSLSPPVQPGGLEELVIHTIAEEFEAACDGAATVRKATGDFIVINAMIQPLLSCLDRLPAREGPRLGLHWPWTCC